MKLAGDQEATASVDDPRNVDCKTAQEVVREWGSQQVGAGDYTAKLPAGWKCDGNSVCRNVNASVTMSLIFDG